MNPQQEPKDPSDIPDQTPKPKNAIARTIGTIALRGAEIATVTGGLDALGQTIFHGGSYLPVYTAVGGGAVIAIHELFGKEKK